mmetsp:Transcript_73488/g.204182  ORF Transcript_73488/g.204182 Transcript_73488/m.204182 type:complete len:202 (+) Transcript_73488:444-1049(+)
MIGRIFLTRQPLGKHGGEDVRGAAQHSGGLQVRPRAHMVKGQPLAMRWADRSYGSDAITAEELPEGRFVVQRRIEVSAHHLVRQFPFAQAPQHRLELRLALRQIHRTVARFEMHIGDANFPAVGKQQADQQRTTAVLRPGQPQSLAPEKRRINHRVILALLRHRREAMQRKSFAEWLPRVRQIHLLEAHDVECYKALEVPP